MEAALGVLREVIGIKKVLGISKVWNQTQKCKVSNYLTLRIAHCSVYS